MRQPASPVRPHPLPDAALLRRYREDGAYTDCYATEVARAVTQAEYVEAFYTTWIFRLERWVLARFAARPSTDGEARALAAGTAGAFAAWRVEDRRDDQLLLCDFRDRTRSWLMSVAPAPGREPRTRLYFGSAVVPVHDARSGGLTLGAGFRALLGFHKLYSRLLLRAAAARLERA